MNRFPFWPKKSNSTTPKARPKAQRSKSEPEFLAMDSGDGTNGLLLQGCYLPEEILRQILGFVNNKSLLQCRAVCKYWRHEIDNEVLKYKIRREQSLHVPLTVINIIASSTTNSWLDLYPIVTKKPFGKNLLKNCSGQDKLRHWEILSNGGHKWDVENPPYGTEEVPEEARTGQSRLSCFCFVTSYHSCSKSQTVELEKVGVTPRVMDVLQPSIEVSEWYARRWDCGAVYEMRVELLDSNHTPLQHFEHRITMDGWYGNDWHKVNHEFINYGPGVRYVMFYHGGTDTQFWAGHYGSKMAGASVVLKFNSETLNRIAAPSGDESEVSNGEDAAL